MGKSSQPAQGFDLTGRIAFACLDLEVEDAREIFVAADLQVGHQQRIDGLLVAGHVLDDLFPVGDRLREIAQLILEQTGDALDDVQLLAGRAGVPQVVLQHLYQPRLVARLLEDVLQSQERVVVARNEFQNLGCGQRRGRQVGQLFHVDGQHASEQADFLAVRRGDLDLLAQERSQVRPALAVFIGLDDIAQGHAVARVDLQDMQADRGRVIEVFQPLRMQAGEAMQDFDLGLGRSSTIGLVDQQRYHLIPLLGLLKDSLLCFPGAFVAR